MPGTTTRLGLSYAQGGDLVSSWPTSDAATAAILDGAAIWKSGTLAARPAANAVAAGTVYLSTDIGQYDISDGTTWRTLLASRGATNISTTESRTNAAYGLLTTPDKVTVTLATNGLIVVAYQALWQESAAGAGRAAIFLGANQLKTGVANSAPLTQAASLGSGTEQVGVDAHLVTCSFGLFSEFLASASPGASADVTTGQALGAVGTSGTSNVMMEIGGSQRAFSDLGGGYCKLFAAAGTYDVSVQFKASSGSVTVKNRKLWVKAEAYG